MCKSASDGLRMHLRAPKISKFSWGGMPPDPPTKVCVYAHSYWPKGPQLYNLPRASWTLLAALHAIRDCMCECYVCAQCVWSDMEWGQQWSGNGLFGILTWVCQEQWHMPSLPFLPFLLQTGHAQDLTDHDWCVRMCVTVYCCFIAWCMQRCTQGEGGGG